MRRFDWGVLDPVRRVNHPADAALKDMVQELESQGVPSATVPPVLGKLPFRPSFMPPRPEVRVVPLMGPQRWRFDAALWRRERLVLYCWDIWPSQLELWRAMLNDSRVIGAIASSRDGCRLLKAVTDRPVIYVPEAIARGRIPPEVPPIVARGVHVLELGRRHAEWHEAVTPTLAARSWRHLYEREAGSIIFATRVDLEAGLRDSQISVCLTRSETHPAAAGGVRTFTLRYLESAANGCIMLGSNPPDLVDLFGYAPVVDIDWGDPGRQIADMLEDPGRFQGLVDRNRDTVSRVGTWVARVPELDGALDVLRKYADSR